MTDNPVELLDRRNLHRPTSRSEFLAAVQSMHGQRLCPRDIADLTGLTLAAVLDLLREIHEAAAP
jgi:hypothetical protein